MPPSVETWRRDEFEALARPHLDALFRTALRMIGQREAAEDLVQETCLKAYKGFGGFEPGSNFKAWLFRILTNAGIDHLKRRARARLVPLEAEGEEGPALAAPGPNPEAALQGKSFREDALAAVAALSPEIRAVVVLAVFEEFTYAEIAEALDCPIGTVRSRLNRGRQLLKARLLRYRGQRPAAELARDREAELGASPGGPSGG